MAAEKGSPMSTPFDIIATRELEVFAAAGGERHIEHYRRVEVGAWLLTEFTGDGVVPLPAIDASLPLDEVYHKVELPPASTRGDQDTTL